MDGRAASPDTLPEPAAWAVDPLKIAMIVAVVWGALGIHRLVADPAGRVVMTEADLAV